MNDLDTTVLADKVKLLFPDSDTTVSANQRTGHVIIWIKQVDGINLGLRELTALARLLDTDRFSIDDQWHAAGCDTCDYGSSHTVQVSFNRADVGVFDSPGIKEAAGSRG